MTGCQPIETAPRDGTRVLVFVPPQADDAGKFETAAGDVLSMSRSDSQDDWIAYQRGWFTAWFDAGHWRTGLRETIEAEGGLDAPTHWMPLPEPPTGGME